MPTIRVPAASVIGSRDGSLSKDALLVNAMFENSGETLPQVIKRPGCNLVESGMSGSNAQGLYTSPYNESMWAVVDNNVYSVNPGVSFTLIGGLTAGSTKQVYFSSTSLDTYIFLHDGTNGYTIFNGTTFNQVSSPGFPTGIPIVPGAVYLDGSIYVMSKDAQIHGSDLENPTNWNALNFLTAQTSPDPGVALAKQLNYLVAFGSNTVQFFYDAGTSPGSPLAPADTYTIKKGCANGDSVVSMSNTVLWVSRERDTGYSVSILEGLSEKVVSTPAVEKILESDPLINVRAFGYKVSGHPLYILSLPDSGITLVYDLSNKTWCTWGTSGRGGGGRGR